MKLLCYGVCLLVLVQCMVSETFGAERTFPKIRNKGEKVNKQHGNKFKFPDRIQYSVDFDGEHLEVNASKQATPHSIRAVDNKGKETLKTFENEAFYMDEDGYVFSVNADVGEDETVTETLSGRIKNGNKVIWIHGNKARSWAVKEHGETDVVLTLDPEDLASPSAQNVTSRRRRSIPTVVEYSTDNTVELAYFVDSRWMRSFRLDNADESSAVEEASLYLTVLTTEMNYIYRSVKTRSEADASIPDFEIVIFGVAMVYPEPAFEFPFIERNVISNDFLEATAAGGALPSFHQWIIDNQGSFNFQWDHFALISGYNLLSSGSSGLLGVTIARVICLAASQKHYSSSLTEDLQHDPVLTLAHELGHSIGSDHDGTSTGNQCATQGYIMSQYAISPTLAMQDTFFTFSTCSVDQFNTHLTNMRNQGRDCLAETSGTLEDFRGQFCQGSRGSAFDLDFQCRHFATFNADSTACITATNIRGEKMVPADACILHNQVTCTTGGSACDRTLISVHIGTPCDGPDSANVAYMCYNGQCVAEESLCDGITATATVRPIEQTPSPIVPCASDCSGLSKKAARQCCRGDSASDGSCCNGCVRSPNGRCVPLQ